MTLTRVCAGVALCLVPVASTMAEMPYVTNLDEALTVAKRRGRTVMLYTGRAELCPNNNPKAFFSDVILKQHPRLEDRSNGYVVCEQFISINEIAWTNDLAGDLSAFTNKVAGYAPLLDRYGIHGLYASLTFLDADGAKLNGPFSFSPPDGEFRSYESDCYETLRDYSEADPPIRMNQAQSNLYAAVFGSSPTAPGFWLFRSRFHAEGGQQTILLDNGLTSTRYELGEQVPFIVRECAVQRIEFGDHAGQYLVAATGRFAQVEPFTGPILLRLNGACFRSAMQEAGTRVDLFPRVSSLSPRRGEHFFLIDVRQKAIADGVVERLKRLQPESKPRNP